MTRIWRTVAVAAVACVLSAAQNLAQEKATKAAARPAEDRLDLEYGFVLAQGDKTTELGLLREVKAGDRFRVRLRPKQAAHGYLFVSKDGKSFDLVLPKEGDAPSSLLARNQWNAVPEKDWLKFDESRGVDQVFLLLSPAPVPEIEGLFAKKARPDAVDQTWLLDLRNKLDADGTATITRAGNVVRASYRRQTPGAVVAVEQIDIRHK